jgi:hypothetical protein
VALAVAMGLPMMRWTVEMVGLCVGEGRGGAKVARGVRVKRERRCADRRL